MLPVHQIGLSVEANLLKHALKSMVSDLEKQDKHLKVSVEIMSIRIKEMQKAIDKYQFLTGVIEEADKEMEVI